MLGQRIVPTCTSPVARGAARARPQRRAPLASLALLLALCLLVSACASHRFPDDRDLVFSMAVEASLAERHEAAAAAAQHFLSGSTPDDPRYDRAARLLANALEELELSYAASLIYLDIAQARRDVELVGDAVRGLERISLRYPYDSLTIRSGFLATEEITGLPAQQRAFVDFLQGLESMRTGLDTWGQARFARIPANSPYFARARYVLAVRDLDHGNLKAARDALEDILEARALPEDVAIDSHRALARIAFEEKRFDDALQAYEQIKKTAPDDPLLLLEMAWTHYYLGNSRRALGLLVALDAPAYANLIAPERFLLEALSLRRLCQFEPARQAAVRLRARHGDALADLERAVPLEDSDALRAAAGLRTGGKDVTDFRQRLQLERALVQRHTKAFGEALSERLESLYARGSEEATRRENESLMTEMIALAEELLAADEGVRLILHELGVGLLRGRGRPPGPPEVDTSSLSGAKWVSYRFEGEFWTDELDDIVVIMEDRCID